MSLNDFEIVKYLNNEENVSIIKVKRKKDGQFYILKNLKFQLLDKKLKEKVLNDIKLLSSLNHPNIIQFKESFFDKPSNTLNLVMESANNGNLSNKISFAIVKNMNLEECIIWDVLTQILHGLYYLHKKGITHINLNSSNSYLTKNRLIKIDDFNSCYILNKKNNFQENQLNISLYSAPELLKKQKYNHKCDIWSVGCIIYEMASLSLPFNGENKEILYNNIKIGKFHPIPSFYSKNLQSIINDMLIFDPSKRPSSDILLNYPNIRETTKKLNSIYDKYKNEINIKNTKIKESENNYKNIKHKKEENLNMALNQEIKNKLASNNRNPSFFSLTSKGENLIPIENINKVENKNIKPIQNKKTITNATYRTLKERKILTKSPKEKKIENSRSQPKYDYCYKIRNNISENKDRNKIYKNINYNRVNFRTNQNISNNRKNGNIGSLSMANKDINILISKKNINNLQSIHSNTNYEKESQIETKKNILKSIKVNNPSNYKIIKDVNNRINNKPQLKRQTISPINSIPGFETNILYKRNKMIQKQNTEINFPKNQKMNNDNIRNLSYINKLNKDEELLNKELDTSSKNYNNNTDILNFKVKYYNNYNNNSKVFKKENKNKIINPQNINNFDKSNIIYNSYKSNNTDDILNRDSNNQKFRFSIKENDISKEKISTVNKDPSDTLNYNDISTEKIIFNKKPINFNDCQLINKNEIRHNIDEFPQESKNANSYVLTIKNSYGLNNSVKINTSSINLKSNNINKETKIIYESYNNNRNSIKKEIIKDNLILGNGSNEPIKKYIYNNNLLTEDNI